MQGKIIKGIAGFYYVHIPDKGIYECKAKGIFRKENQKPVVGDDVVMDIIGEETKTGNIVQILPRRNQLIRPAVANIHQAVVIFSVVKPEPNLALLDRFLVMMEYQKIPCRICFNKADLADEEKILRLRREYEASGYPLLFVSAKEQTGLGELREWLTGKTSTVAGPSGVGKSSLINRLQNTVCMETGNISEKIERGKHTTRHAQLISVGENSYIMDTPGFSSLAIPDMEKEELRFCYPEFAEYENTCKYSGCMHISEPGCQVKAALADGTIGKNRYENYIQFFEELKNRKKYETTRR